MSRFLLVIWRLVLATTGYVLACLALSAFVHLLVLGGLQKSPDEARFLTITSMVTIPVVAAFAGYHLFLPGWIAVLVSEFFAFRDWLFHAFAGAVAALAGLYSASLFDDAANDTGLLATALASGLVFGIAYWLVAGRSAGFLASASDRNTAA